MPDAGLSEDYRADIIELEPRIRSSRRGRGSRTMKYFHTLIVLVRLVDQAQRPDGFQIVVFGVKTDTVFGVLVIPGKTIGP